MTINKAQGQTLERVWAFTFRSLASRTGSSYVAASRVGLPDHRFAVPIDKDTDTFRTCNVVFREALTDRPD